MENLKAFGYAFGFGLPGFIADILYCGSHSEILFGFLGLITRDVLLFFVGWAALSAGRR